MRTGGPRSPGRARRCGHRASPGGSIPSSSTPPPPRPTSPARALPAGPSARACTGPEFAALAGEEASPDAVMAYAGARQTTVALTGPVDWVSDGERFVAIENGHPLMKRVTAIGCATTALVAALTALEEDAFIATACG